jgi:hypothetical protein
LVITITSFRQAQVGIRVAGGERSLEIDKMAIEFVELRSGAGQSDPLRGDQGAEVASHQVALAGQAQVGKLTRDGQVEAELTQADDEPKPAEVVGRVLAIAVRLPRRLRQDALALIEADPFSWASAHRQECWHGSRSQAS